ncbi:MAG TPA: sulfatase-like hydrolase/transferase [Phycisphaerae bacterium]|nr:sulfatase-like hydrolase/transferase [Phycisphaerae bacterium]
MKMNRREFLAAAAAGAAAAALPRGLLAQSRPAGRPNIVLCMTDDQGWGDTSYNGLTAIKTPTLDEMAAGGLRFNRFYAAAPLCSPTRGSVMTGRHPFRYGCLSHGMAIGAREMTIAQVLKQAGYATGHFGKWHLNGVVGPGRVIRADDPLSPGKMGFDEWLSVTNYFDLNWTLSRNGRPEKHAGDGSDVIVAEALKYIEQCTRQKRPFLAVVWFGSPHDPHKPLEADRQAAGGKGYYGELLGVDRAMGTLRAGLRRLGVAENTLVWFNSDNGAIAGSNGGLRGKKNTLWEGGIRVPGIIEWPARIARGATTDVVACTSDIYPTLLELLDITRPDQVLPLDGVPLAGLLDGRIAQRPRPIGFWHNVPRTEKNLAVDMGHAALLDNRYKLHRLPGHRYSLYDLMDDAKESKDLAGTKPDVVKAMGKTLDEWLASVVKSFRGADYPPAGGGPA